MSRRKEQAVTGGPWELTLVLLLSATVFFSRPAKLAVWNL